MGGRVNLCDLAVISNASKRMMTMSRIIPPEARTEWSNPGFPFEHLFYLGGCNYSNCLAFGRVISNVAVPIGPEANGPFIRWR
jgi:hypothetical protein